MKKSRIVWVDGKKYYATPLQPLQPGEGVEGSITITSNGEGGDKMVTDRELNERLLKFAGFKEAPKNRFYYEIGGEKRIKWIAPGRFEYAQKPPDFIHSIDLCFKWLVPKLLEQGLFIGLGAEANCWGCWILNSNADVEAETPALALCKAIEQLIDQSRV